MNKEVSEKIYTQAELNAAVAKAIHEMTEVLETRTDELKALRVKLEKNSKELEYLRHSYVDACNLCTRTNCDDCALRQIIDDLAEVLQKAREEE